MPVSTSASLSTFLAHLQSRDMVSTLSSWRQGSQSHPAKGMSLLLHYLVIVPCQTINPGIIVSRSFWLLPRASFHYRSHLAGCEWVSLCPQGGHHSDERIVPPSPPQWAMVSKSHICKALGDMIKTSVSPQILHTTLCSSNSSPV